MHVEKGVCVYERKIFFLKKIYIYILIREQSLGEPIIGVTKSERHKKRG